MDTQFLKSTEGKIRQGRIKNKMFTETVEVQILLTQLQQLLQYNGHVNNMYN